MEMKNPQVPLKGRYRLLVIVTTTVAVLSSVWVVEIQTQHLVPHPTNPLATDLVVTALTCVSAMCPFVVVFLPGLGLNRRPFSVGDILLTYLCVVISFAGVYYSLTLSGDYHDAINKYYQALPDDSATEKQQSLRAFAGIEERFYSYP